VAVAIEINTSSQISEFADHQFEVETIQGLIFIDFSA